MSLTFRCTCPMSTRGSIAIVRQRYRCECDPGQRPEAVTHPRGADDVRLHGEDERGAECGSDTARRPPSRPARAAHERDEDCEPPRRPDERTKEARLDTDLGVVRLPGLDRRSCSRCRLPRIAESVALGVTHDRSRTLAQADQVASDRRFIEAAPASACAWTPLGDVALTDEILLRPLSLGRDMRKDVDPRGADRERRNGGGDRPPVPCEKREHDKAGGEREQRRTGEREQKP